MKVKGKLLAVISVCLLLSSCLSFERVVKTVFDPSLPEAHSSKVLFWLDVTSYNGIDIHKAWGADKNIPLVTLPPGKRILCLTHIFPVIMAMLSITSPYTTVNSNIIFKAAKNTRLCGLWKKNQKKYCSPKNTTIMCEFMKNCPIT